MDTEPQTHALPCPRCQTGLVCQPMDDAAAATCTFCGGLWLDHATFGRLQAEHSQAAEGRPPRTSGRPVAAEGPVRYLRCPACEAFMHRTNFGRVSGVLVDICHAHGLWFDADELQQVLDFIELGGLAVGARRDADQEARRRRQVRSAESGEETAALALKKLRTPPRWGKLDGGTLELFRRLIFPK